MPLNFTGPTDVHHRAKLEHEILRSIWSPGGCEPGQRVKLLVHANVPDGTVFHLSVEKRGFRPETFKAKGFPASIKITAGIGQAEWQVDFDDPDFAKYQHVSLRYKATSDPLKLTGVSQNLLEVGTPAVSVRELQTRFAPKQEALQIQYTVYDPQQKTRAAVLRVYGQNYNKALYPAVDAVVYEQRLSADQFSPGAHTFSWRGECTCKAAPLDPPASGASRFINPLFSPYVVEVELSRAPVDEKATWPAAGTVRSFPAPENFLGTKLKKAGSGLAVVEGEAPAELAGLEVLYHSIELRQGSYLEDDTIPLRTADKKRWALLLLNLLGYHAGPEDAADAVIALRRFQHNNYKPGTEDLLKITGPAGTSGIAGPSTGTIMGGALNADTENALAECLDARAFYEDGPTPFVHDCKIYFDDCYGYGDKMDRTVIPGYDRWRNDDRPGDVESVYFGRGWVPVQARVRVKGMDGSPVFSPEAAGPVKVLVEFEELHPDDSVITSNNPSAVTYVTKARRFGAPAGTANLTGTTTPGPATTTGAARRDNSGTNCPASAGGFRDDDPSKYIQQVFEGGTKFKPFTVDFGTRTKDGRTIHFARCTANMDEKFRPWLGRGGVWWRPSCKAGDGYVVKARLSFEGQANEKFLGTRNDAEALTGLSGEFRVWRRTRVASYIAQNGRPATNPLNWPAVSTEFGQGFLEFENSGLPFEVATFKDYCSPKEYQAIVKKAVSPGTINSFTESDYRFDEHHLWPFPIPAQGASESVGDYFARMQGLFKQFEKLIEDPLNDMIRSKVRKEYPEGYIITDIRPFPSFPLRFPTGTVNQLMGATAIGRSDLQVWMIEPHSSVVPMLFPHEMGHCRFFLHGFTTNTSFEGPQDHDEGGTNQMNARSCTMSYASATTGLQDTNQHFCGKCVLKLRGWDEHLLPSKYD